MTNLVEGKIEGYLSEADRQMLIKYAGLCDRPIVDVGCHKGLSSAILARAAPKCMIYAVDPHATFTGMNGMVCNGEDRTEFYRNMANSGLAPRVSLIGLPSTQAAQAIPDGSVGMVFIDGDHRRAKEDLLTWFPKLTLGGFALMHDIDLQPVRNAVYWASQTGDVAYLETRGITAALQKHPERLKTTPDGRPLVFVHIPKTAGLSVLFHVAKPKGFERMNHVPASVYRQHMGAHVYDKALSFAVVRHPFYRMRSAWTYLKRQNPEHRWWDSDHYEREFILPMGKTFEEFVMNAPDNIAALPRQAPHFLSQFAFLCSEAGLIVKRLLRFERLDEDWTALMKECGALNRTLPHNNVTAGLVPAGVMQSSKIAAASKEMAERVAKLYEADYELLGREYSPDVWTEKEGGKRMSSREAAMNPEASASK